MLALTSLLPQTALAFATLDSVPTQLEHSRPLVLHLTSIEGFLPPQVRLRHQAACAGRWNALWEPSAADSLAWRLPDFSTQSSVTIAGGTLPIGDPCFALVDAGAPDAPGPQFRLRVSHSAGPRQLAFHSNTPMRFSWERPYAVPYMRLQLLDTTAGADLVLWDWTTSQDYFLPLTRDLPPLNAGARYTWRAANAFDSVGNDAPRAWTTLRILAPGTPGPGPQPLWPLEGAVLEDAAGQEFLWNAMPGTQQYRLDVFHLQTRQWVPCLARVTTDTLVRLPGGSLCAGALAWRVSAMSAGQWHTGSTARCSLDLEVDTIAVQLRTLYRGDTLLVDGARLRATPYSPRRAVQTATGPLGPGKAELALASGAWDLEVLTPGFAPLHTTLRPPLPPRLDLWLASPQAAPLAPTASAPRVLQGQVRTPEGIPLVGIRLQAWSEDGALLGQTQSHGDGSFSLSAHSETHLLSALGPGRRAQWVSVGSAPREFDLRMPAGQWAVHGLITRSHWVAAGDLRLQPLPEILVQAHLPGTEVRIYTQSDLRGIYELSLPRAGNWVISATTATDTSRQNITVQPHSGNQNIAADLEFHSGARLRVVAKSPAPRPLSILFQLTSAGTPFAQVAAPLQNGLYTGEFSDLPAGSYSVHAQAVGMESTSDSIAIPLQPDFTTRYLVMADTLQLQEANRRLRMHLRPPPQHQAQWTAVLPQVPWLNSGDTLSGLGAIPVRMQARSTDPSRLPVHAHWVAPSATPPVHLDTLAFPFRNLTPSSQFLAHPDSAISFALLAPAAQLDSAVMELLDASGGVQTRLPAQRRGDTLFYSHRPGDYSPRWLYQFRVHRARTQWCNCTPEGTYTLDLLFPARPFRLQWSWGDTLHLVTGAHTDLLPGIQDSRGLDYSSEFRGGGRFSWALHGNAIALSTTPDSLQAQVSATAPGLSRVVLRAIHEDFQDSASLILRVWPRDSIQSIQVQLEAASPLWSGDSVALQVRARTANGDFAQVPAEVQIHPALAARWDGQLLWIDSSFIGPLRITTGLGSLSDTLITEAWAQIRPYARERWLHHGDSLFLRVPDSAWGGEGHLAVRLLALADSTLAAPSPGQGLAVSSFFALEFPRGIPRVPLQLAFPTPGDIAAHFSEYNSQQRTHTTQAQSASPALARLSYADSLAASADTLILPDGQRALAVAPRGARPLYYGLLGEQTATDRPWLQLLPNPFSPHITALADGNALPGQAIHFHPFIPGRPEVLVSLKVYNMAGERVRTLLEQALVPNRAQVTWWDGLTDSGRLARNGRYLVVMEVRTSAGSKVRVRQKQYSVVFQ